MSGIIAQNTLDNTGLIKSPEGGGAWNFIKKLTADGSGTALTFVDGSSDVVLDSTYKVYSFTFNNIHPATNNAAFQLNFRDGGSSYDATKTTTLFKARHAEDDSSSEFGYEVAYDVAQDTGVAPLTESGIRNGNDDSLSGYMYLYDPSNTTFVKHFMATCQYAGSTAAFTFNTYVAGYANVTAAIDGVQFSLSTGNMDLGDICLYGLSDS